MLFASDELFCNSVLFFRDGEEGLFLPPSTVPSPHTPTAFASERMADAKRSGVPTRYFHYGKVTVGES